MKMRLVTFSLFQDRGRACRWAGAAMICCAAFLLPAPAADSPEQGLQAKPAVTQPAGLKLPAAVPTASPAVTASLTNVTTAQSGGDLVFSILTDTPVQKTRQYEMSDPPRLVVDLVNVFNNLTFFDLRVNSLGVKKVRVRQFQSVEPKIVRLVFELDENHGGHEIRRGGDALQIVFHTGGDVAEPQVSKAADRTSDEPRAGSEAPAELPAPKVTPPVAAKPSTTTAPAPKAQPPAEAKPVATAGTEQKTASPVRPAAPVQAAPSAPAATAKSSPPATPAPKVQAPAANVARTAADEQNAASVGRPGPAQSPASVKPAETVSGIAMLRDPAAIDLSGSALVPATPVPVVSTARPAQEPAAAALALSAQFTGHPLTLDLIDISLVDFFRLMAEEGGINVVMDPEIRGTLSIKVVKVPWDQIFEAALSNNGLDKQIEGNLVRIARKSTLQEEAKQRESLKKANLLAADVETRIKRLNYAKATEFVTALTEQKSVRGTVVVDERTNSLILTDIPSSLDRMLRLVETLDIPQPQVEIEARIVAATRDFARDIGVQFGFVQGNLQRVTVGGPNTFGTIGGTRPTATPTNTFAAGNPSTGRGASQSTSSQSAGVSTGLSNSNAGNLNVNLPAQKAFGGIGLSVGNIFDTFLLDAAITAGETKGLAKLISQPKVTAQNNSPASITQGVRFPVQIIANNTVTVQFQNAALTLTVTPQITYEGNIVLDLKVENNTPDFANSVNGIPSIRTSESNTRVLVTDGGTTVIGGILIDNETTQEDRVPGLASLPVIGNIFRRSLVSHSTQEVLFFITPRVIK